MFEKPAELKKLFEEKLASVTASADIEQLRIEFLGKKGSVAALMQELRNIPNDQKKEAGQAINETKQFIENAIAEKLEEVRKGIYEKALANRESKTYICKNTDEIKSALAEKGDGFVKAMWCGEEECEDKVKEETGVGSRCIPLISENLSDVCVCCGKPAKHMVLWAIAY
jgi:prolyl-tRNA synthetase